MGGPPRALVYHHALGNETRRLSCYSLPGNRGNTMVRDEKPQGFDESGEAHVVRLDDLVKPLPSLYVHLLKIDAEGMDLEVLQGAASLIRSGCINAVRFELGADPLPGGLTS